MKTIFRTVKVCKYTQINNDMLRDRSLSLKAKGLLAMILTHSDEWVVTKSWLEGICLEGKDSIQAALDELREAGYAQYDGQKSGPNGQFLPACWTFFEEPHRSGFSRSGKTGDGKPAPKKTISPEDNQREENHSVGNGFPTPQLPQERPVPFLEANPEAEPKGQGRETPHVPRTPLTPKAPFRTKDTPRARNPLLEAMALCGGGSLEHMTPPEWGRAAKALKDIRSVKPDLTVEDIRVAIENYTKLYGSGFLTSTAISNNWSKIRPGAVIAPKVQQSASKPEESWKIQKKIEQIEELINTHKGNEESTKCDDPNNIAPEDFAAFKALKAKRRELLDQLAKAL
jgi:hypothetical protein